MIRKDILLHSYAFNLKYAEELVVDVTSHLMTKSGGDGLENHPAFTLGHLTMAAALTSKYLGGPYDVKPDWIALFKRSGPGDSKKPITDASLYPNKEELLMELNKQHKGVEKLIDQLEEERYQEPTDWRFKDYLPTLGDLVYFMCVTHESMHLGQLASWRRAMGLPSALARL